YSAEFSEKTILHTESRPLSFKYIVLNLVKKRGSITAAFIQVYSAEFSEK
ncbi:hypothetical protein L9F63_022073, partial [Diploptera punctata]